MHHYQPQIQQPREMMLSGNTDTSSDHTDHLSLVEKIPLTLALLAQSYVVFLWYFKSTHGIHPYIDFVVAFAAGIALDWLTVSTVMGRREGRTSIWSWLTSFGAFLGSAMIAYDTYAAQWWPLNGKALLHVCYPLVVLLYSLHLASPRRVSTSKRLHRDTSQPDIQNMPATGMLPGIQQHVVETLPATTSTQFPCPLCGASLDSIAELGAAKRWGHCRYCKSNVKSTASSSTNHIPTKE